MTTLFYTILDDRSIGDSDFRISNPQADYHFGLSIREIEDYPGADVRKTAEGEVFVILPESDFNSDEVIS